jgi:flagellar hook-length control protein FliK
LTGIAGLPSSAAAAAAASENTGLARAVSLAEARAEPAHGTAGALTNFPATGQALPAPGASMRAADAGATFSAQLGAALGSPEFAPALGAQLSLLVRDGIQRAQLQLHPLEMGPISVRISLDGNQAKIDFSAAHAATRQALEDAVPVLAGALREAGLTLSGGGVFQQPRDARDTGAQPDQARSGATPQGETHDADHARHGATLPVRQRGIVDLIA